MLDIEFDLSHRCFRVLTRFKIDWHASQNCQYRAVVASVGGLYKVFKVRPKYFVWCFRNHSKYLREECRAYSGIIRPQLLVKFFSGAHTSVLDFDICSGTQPGSFYKPARNICYLDRVSHIEHENISVRSQCRSLENQPHCIRNGHKITGHMFVGNRDRTTTFDLAKEYRDNTSTASQNIAKPNTRAAR